MDTDKPTHPEKPPKIINCLFVLMNLSNGWIYKKATELAEETMLSLKETAMRTHISYLVDQGWLSRRRNPDEKWDKTFQYRVNLIKIQVDLFKLGYVLEGYKHPFSSAEILRILSVENLEKSEPPNSTHRTSENELRETKNEDRTADIEVGSSENDLRSTEKRGAIPETITKITSETTSEINDPIIDTWAKTLDNIRESVNEQVYNTWFAKTTARIEGNTLMIVAPYSFNKEWLESRYLDLIKDTLALFDSGIIEFKIIALEDKG
ncbi:DnaA N-terminal domain-containing protein [Desulfosporosinus nitroreducens]|uniref:DnaA N-terminal domain-containing protein n=1 Tax=Desulfosporosinus nitroreducens TaxID=2018668 RepID=A0ABT8QQA1_9FIRM|nr:DnaA N-terminal domain-containing protein [Desulfosporosinus nitroreducens]MDO0823511.1 hypothetical protein [Desulfosporosinus nitroreducens]